jgi:hypothetical protein
MAIYSVNRFPVLYNIIRLHGSERAKVAFKHAYVEILSHDYFVNSSEILKLKLDLGFPAGGLNAPPGE